jgi:hypothetical protein
MPEALRRLGLWKEGDRSPISAHFSRLTFELCEVVCPGRVNFLERHFLPTSGSTTIRPEALGTFRNALWGPVTMKLYTTL